MTSEIRFEERTGYAWWVHAVIAFVVLSCLAPSALGLGLVPGIGESQASGEMNLPTLFLGIGIPLLFYGLMGELRTRITDTKIVLAWGMTELIRKEILFSEIRAVKAVTYSPLLEFGGWGIRWGMKGKRAWTTRGNRALRVDLADGGLFYIGSDRPERMVPWIRPGQGKEEDA